MTHQYPRNPESTKIYGLSDLLYKLTEYTAEKGQASSLLVSNASLIKWCVV